MIPFTDKDWDRVLGNYRKWRKNELGRPILPCVLYGRDAGRPAPSNELLSFGNVADFSITADQIVDKIDYELSRSEFYGDAYPYFNMSHFGPGVVAAFLGAELESSPNTVWFHPKEILPIEDLHFEYDGSNVWVNRLKDIYAAGMKRWRGEVVLAMTDLGGILDILATFRGTENLLMDLYDAPEEVERLVREVQALWLRYYDEFNEILKGSRGYSDWGTILSEEPSYMIQSDFSYMISPDMFDQFVAEEVKTTAAHMKNAFYHLDGVGQLAHLDTLLSTDTLQGIQWVPGEGAPVEQDWSDVYRKISSRGKKIQAYYGFEKHLDEILAVIERPDDLVKMQFVYDLSDKKRVLEKLASYGVEI